MTEVPEDLSELVRAHWPELYAMLVPLTSNAATAEDLTQEVFLLAYRKQMRAGPGLRLWLREVARRLAMNELRRKRPEPLGPDELERVIEATVAIESDQVVPAFEEQLAALRVCLAGLSEDDRALLAARYERDEGLACVAVQTQQTIGYLKQRLFRLRRRLAACVRQRLAAPEDSYAQPRL